MNVIEEGWGQAGECGDFPGEMFQNVETKIVGGD